MAAAGERESIHLSQAAYGTEGALGGNLRGGTRTTSNEAKPAENEGKTSRTRDVRDGFSSPPIYSEPLGSVLHDSRLFLGIRIHVRS